MGFIYKVTNTINGNVYIGQTKRSVEKRWQEHIESKYKYDFAFARALRKYPENSFRIETIEEIPDENLNERESYWIRYYNSFYNGYNCTLGGESRPSIEQNIVRELWDSEYSAKDISVKCNCSRSTVTRILQNFDTYTIEESRKRGNRKHGRKIVQYDLQGIYIASFDSISEASAETGVGVSGIRKACRGTSQQSGGYQWRYSGDIPPGEFKVSVLKPVSQHSIDGELLQTFESVTSAGRISQIDASCISACCRGKQKTAGGFIWKYAS